MKSAILRRQYRIILAALGEIELYSRIGRSREIQYTRIYFLAFSPN